MLQLSAVILEAPAKAHLNQKELADWLDISAKTLRKYIREKRLPAGESKDGQGKRHYWNRDRAALAKKIYDNRNTWFTGELEPLPRGKDAPEDETADAAGGK